MLKRFGFTLIELLVVIGIIALLLALLLPAANRVRFNAKCTLCAANLRQISAAMSHYATDNSGWFPAMPRGGAGNAYDESKEFCNLLSGVYRIPRTSMYCPFQDDEILAAMTADGFSIQFGYLTWIPQVCGRQVLAPPLIPGSPPFSYPMPLDPTPFAGPQRLSDSTAKDNPLFTDFVTSEGIAPSTARASDAGNPYSISWFSNHQWRNHFENINSAFADGHVEAVMGDAVRPRYVGNRLSWR